MNLEGRIKRLEQAIGHNGDWCTCPDGARVLFEDAEPWRGEPDRDPGPETCPECGRRRQTVVVAFVETPWRDLDNALGPG